MLSKEGMKGVPVISGSPPYICVRTCKSTSKEQSCSVITSPHDSSKFCKDSLAFLLPSFYRASSFLFILPHQRAASKVAPSRSPSSLARRSASLRRASF